MVSRGFDSVGLTETDSSEDTSTRAMLVQDFEHCLDPTRNQHRSVADGIGCVYVACRDRGARNVSKVTSRCAGHSYVAGQARSSLQTGAWHRQPLCRSSGRAHFACIFEMTPCNSQRAILPHLSLQNSLYVLVETLRGDTVRSAALDEACRLPQLNAVFGVLKSHE